MILLILNKKTLLFFNKQNHSRQLHFPITQTHHKKNSKLITATNTHVALAPSHLVFKSISYKIL